MGAVALNRRFSLCLALSHSDVRTNNAWTPYWFSSSTHLLFISSLSTYVSVMATVLHVCARKPHIRQCWYGWRWGWFSVSALLWCTASFPIACLWLINHIDWSVSGREGWPVQHAMKPLLSRLWTLAGGENTKATLRERWGQHCEFDNTGKHVFIFSVCPLLTAVPF